MKARRKPHLDEVRKLLLNNRTSEALAACEKLIVGQPADAGLRALQAEILLRLGRTDDALFALNDGLDINPDHADMRRLRGALHLAKGHQDAALADFERAAAVQPDSAEAWHNAGLIHATRDHYDKALVSFERAIAAHPANPEHHYQRGLALKAMGRTDEAIGAFDQAATLQPASVRFVCTLADSLRELDRADEALDRLDKVLTGAPDDPALHNHRGAMLFALGRYDEALASYDRALAASPDFIDALGNRGVVLSAFDRENEAELSLRRALALDPGRVVTHWNLALCLLRLGKLEEAWREHEWRWKKPEFKRFDFQLGQPRWDGTQSMDGKVLLLTAEQGLGDSLQFVRYAQQLIPRVAKLLLFVQTGLVELFAHSFPDALVSNSLESFPNFDFHCPLLSLPWACGTTESSIPATIPYLAPPLRRIAKWQQKLPSAGKARVGLVWAGSPRHKNDINRSLPLETLAPLLAIDSCDFVVLQCPLAESDRQSLSRYPNVTVCSDGLADFADTAAVISLLDLVISVDTSVAHLAGALGKPVWILVPRLADWRWMLHRTDSPWYPTAALYRVTGSSDWTRIVARLGADLRDFRPVKAVATSGHATTNLADALQFAAELQRNGQLDDAIALYRGVLQLDPNDFDANHMLGVARNSQGAPDEAASLVRRALNIRPGNPVALKNLFYILLRGGKHEEVIATSEQILAREPSAAAILADRAVSMIALKDYDRALDSLDRALAIAPEDFRAWNNRGTVLLNLGRRSEALNSLDKALALKPGFVDAISNRGLALLALDRPRDAIENYQSGLAQHPDSIALSCNFAVSLVALNRLEEAVSQARMAIALDPRNVDAHWNLSLALLALGRYREGWQEYEWRWQRVEMAPHLRNYKVPQWSGSEDLSGRTLLLHSEQGFGDTFQFLRYLPLLTDTGAKLVVTLPESIRALAEASFPQASFHGSEQALPRFDYHLPMMSLPLAFGTTLESIPSSEPAYLRPPPDRITAWRTRLPATEKCRVGLAWSGNPAHLHDRRRSISLDLLRPLFGLANIEFHALQKDFRPTDAAIAETLPNLKLTGPGFADFADAAAAILQLDLVISVDTSVAHLAGALGKPVWIILPFAADWRWLTERDDSPWYPSARLFRQRENMAQSDTIDRIRHALGKFAAQAST